jgi:hypothetical protein
MRVLTLFLDQWNNNCNRAISKENVRLVDIGVLGEDYSSEWSSPSFAIPKKNRASTMRVVSDFRKLNLLLKRHPFPIPKIGDCDMICSMEGFTFASALDLNMGYYNIKLDADVQNLCTIVFPWENTNTNAYPWVSRLPES